MRRPLHAGARWLPAAAILFIVTIVYVLVIRVTDMHADEYLVYYQTRLDLGYTFWYQTFQDVHPPLWFSFFWVWRQFVGISEFAGRMQAILFSMITLSLVYQIGREWFGARRYGLMAMALLGVSAYHVAYAVEIRPYGLTMMLAALSMLWFGRWVQRGERRWALAWGALAGVMLYVHYFTAFLLIAQGVYALAFARPLRRVLAQGTLAALVGAIVWLPWLPQFMTQVNRLRQLSEDAGRAYASGLGTTATASATSPETIERLLALMTNGEVALYVIMIGLGIALLWRRRLFWLAIMWALGVPAITLAINTVAAVYSPRYIAYLTPGLALAAGAGIAALAGRWRWTAGAIAVALIGIGLPATLPNRAPLRDIFREMSAQASADDAVYFADGEGDGWFNWQIDLYLNDALHEHRLTRLDGELPRRVWYVTSEWLTPRVQDEFHRLEQTHPLQVVLGDCMRYWCFLSQLMEAPPERTPQVFGGQIGYYGADIEQADRRTVRARLWWKVDAPVPLDYSIGVQLLSSSGELVAQSDGPINHYNAEVVQTSQMEPGQIYIDYQTLTPTTELPPGDYLLAVVIYQSWDGVRLTLDDGRDFVEVARVEVD